MEFVSVPSIIVICYLIGEAYKFIVKKDKEKYKFIPVLVSIAGGLIGVLFYYTYPEMILNAQNPIIALMIGIASGSAATGSNQIIKQLFGDKLKEINNENGPKNE